MGSAKTANADRSATLTNPLPIPSFSLTFRLYALVATFFGGSATGIPPTKANKREETTRTCGEFRSLSLLLSVSVSQSNKDFKFRGTFNRSNDTYGKTIVFLFFNRLYNLKIFIMKSQLYFVLIFL